MSLTKQLLQRGQKQTTLCPVITVDTAWSVTNYWPHQIRMRWPVSTLSVASVGLIISRRKSEVDIQALTPDACKRDAIWKLATLYLKTFWLNHHVIKKFIGSGFANPSRMKIRTSSGVQMCSVITAVSEKTKVVWSMMSHANAEPFSVSCVEISRTSLATAKQQECGLKNRMLSLKMWPGLQQTRKVVPNVREVSRKIRDVTIWRALNVDMNSVGFAWVIGKVTDQQLEDITNATCTRIKRKMRALLVKKPNERTQRRSYNVICGTTNALPTMIDQDNLL